MAGSQRMQSVNYRLLTYLLPVPTLVFCSLSLTGCISNSPGVSSIFTVRLSTDYDSHIKVGYYGMCASTSTGLLCQSTSGKNTEKLIANFDSLTTANGTTHGEAPEMIKLAQILQSSYLIGLLAVAGSLFTISLFFIALLKRDFKVVAQNSAAQQRRRRLRQAGLTSLWLSVAFALASATATDQTVNAMTLVSSVILSGARVNIAQGKTLSVLQWLAFGFSTVFGLGMSLIFRTEGGVVQSVGSGKVEQTASSTTRSTTRPTPPTSCQTSSRSTATTSSIGGVA